MISFWFHITKEGMEENRERIEASHNDNGLIDDVEFKKQMKELVKL